MGKSSFEVEGFKGVINGDLCVKTVVFMTLWRVLKKSLNWNYATLIQPVTVVPTLNCISFKVVSMWTTL